MILASREVDPVFAPALKEMVALPVPEGLVTVSQAWVLLAVQAHPAVPERVNDPA